QSTEASGMRPRGTSCAAHARGEGVVAESRQGRRQGLAGAEGEEGARSVQVGLPPSALMLNGTDREVELDPCGTLPAVIFSVGRPRTIVRCAIRFPDDP